MQVDNASAQPRRTRRRVLRAMLWASAALVLTLPSLEARGQWSLGRPDGLRPPPGENQYLYLVRTNPLPGQEQEFNDAYQNVHMGDLAQLDGYVGAQRFRSVNNVLPHATTEGYRYGYLIIWDLQGSSRPPSSQVGAAIAGGKARRLAGYDYVSPDAAWSVTYKALEPRRRRPDGRGPFMPAASDNTHPRPDRYVFLEFDNPPPGMSDAEFETTLDRRVSEVLSLPGWMAAQRLRYEPGSPLFGRLAWPAAKCLTVYETEGQVQDAQDALTAAIKGGKVTYFERDMTSAESTWWLPISPFIDKSSFNR